jgi:hypothetical protein
VTVRRIDVDGIGDGKQIQDAAERLDHGRGDEVFVVGGERRYESNLHASARWQWAFPLLSDDFVTQF